MKRITFNDNWKYLGENGVLHISLPYDATQIIGRRADDESGKAGAYYCSGKFIFEKDFYPDENWRNKKAYLEFEGVYPTAEIFLNEKKVGECKYGYSTFVVELPDLKINQKNTVRVLVDDTNHPNSRWYAGAGIYRPVWLILGAESHITPKGIRIKTLSINPAVISVDVNAVYSIPEEIIVEILKDDVVIATATGIHSEIKIQDALLWTAEHPELYKCRVSICKNKEVIDVTEETFGIRTIQWSKDGFFINGESVLLRGGCIHSDNGILGARSYRESEFRRIHKLKECEYNAIRSAHNPIARDVLDACDSIGMYVLDESWDTWYKTKNEFDFGNGFYDRYETDLEQMIEKDYNHPSVIMYSVGNEVTEPAKPEGIELAGKLVETVKKLDDTRPVTAGINITLLLLAALPVNPLEAAGNESGSEMNSEDYNRMVSEGVEGMSRICAAPQANESTKELFSKFDIAGYNYGITRYELDAKENPDRVVVGTETYCQDIGRVWPVVEKYPYLIGDFMWTAWDYLGEVGIGGFSYEEEDCTFDKKYPWELADCGAIDILGNETGEAGLAKVVFTNRMKPYIAVTPANKDINKLAKAMWRGTDARSDWSYKDCDGNPVNVEVYSAADSVELFVNDKSIGIKKIQDYNATFETTYEAGVIKAVSFDRDGTIVGENELHSAKNAGVKILREKSYSNGYGKEEIIYFSITIADDEGTVECNADETLTVSVEGGELLAFGSANPKTVEEFTDGRYTTYYGRAQAVVKQKDELGRIIVVASDGTRTELSF